QKYRCSHRIGAFVLQPVEPHIGARFEDHLIDRVREIFDVEHALVVDGHSKPFATENHRAWRDWKRGCAVAPTDPASSSGTIRTDARHQASRPRRADAANRRPRSAAPDWLSPALRETAAHPDS